MRYFLFIKYFLNMKKHEILENEKVEKLVFGGTGLATAEDGRKILISGGVIPEAIVDIRILKIKKNHIEAQVVRTVKKSPFEREIPENWQLYGGCKWLPIPYEKQLEIKENQIKEAFFHIQDRVKNATFHPIIASVETEHYRNKVEFSWGKYISARENIHDEYRFGFHFPGAFDRIENCRYCVLADDEVNEIFREVDAIARNSDFPTYDPKTQIGFWRHLVIRKAKYTNEIMLIFSVNGIFDQTRNEKNILINVFFANIAQQLSEKFPNIVSIFALENTGKADIVAGDAKHIFGKLSITEKLFDFSFEIQPKSFFQVNTFTAEKLYQCAIDFLTAKNDSKAKDGILLDLYAGTGTIGMLLSRYFREVYSVELVTSASQDGEKNAFRNGVKNMHFINQKVEDFAQDFSRKNLSAHSIVVDPPRDGLHSSAIENILNFAANEIIYVSCNPATLVRDLELMTATEKYEITDIRAVDMFPHTHHIETVVRLVKK